MQPPLPPPSPLPTISSSACAWAFQDMLGSGAKYGLAGITRGTEGEDLEDIIAERLQPWLSSLQLSKRQMDQWSKLSVFGGTFCSFGAAHIGSNGSEVALEGMCGLGLLNKPPVAGQQLQASFLPEPHNGLHSCDRYSMHPLVRVAASVHLTQDRSMHDSTVAAFFDFILLLTVSSEAWGRLSEPEMKAIGLGVLTLAANEQQNIKEMHRVLENCSQGDPPISSLISETRAVRLQAAANGLRSFGHLQLAYTLMQASVTMRGSLQAPDPLIYVLLDFAQLCVVMDKQQTAEAALRRAVQASDDRNVSSDFKADAHAKLAGFLTCQGRPSEAEPLLHEALAAFGIWDGMRSQDVCEALLTLGIALRDMGRLEEAEARLYEALTLSLELFGPEHPRISFCLRSLAAVLFLAGDPSRVQHAEDTEEAALAILEPCLQASRSSDSAGIMLVDSYGGHQSIFSLWEYLITSRSMRAQGVHPVARSLGCAAARLEKQDMFSGAEAKVRSALDICGQEFGSTHEQHVYLSITLAAIMKKQDRKQEAKTLLQQAIKAGESLDPELEHALIAKIRLASLVSNLGEEEEALGLMRDVLAVRSNKHGPDHPLTTFCQALVSNAQANLRKA